MVEHRTRRLRCPECRIETTAELLVEIGSSAFGPRQVLWQPAVHVDETGWRTAVDSRALWTMMAPSASIFQIAEHCSREQFNALIGPFEGIIVSDR